MAGLLTQKWLICYSSQRMFENPTVNLSALRRSREMIALIDHLIYSIFR